MGDSRRSRPPGGYSPSPADDATGGINQSIAGYRQFESVPLKRRGEFLRLAGFGSAIGRFHNVDDVAGVLRRDRTVLVVANHHGATC